MAITTNHNHYHPLINRLLQLHNNSELEKISAGSNARAKLAILSRGMQNRLSQISPIPMYTALSKEFYLSTEHEELQGIAVASLFGYSHKAVPQRDKVSLGHALKALSKKRDSGSLETRVMALLKSNTEHLPGHLRQIISLLMTAEIGLDWYLLLKHVFDWEHPDYYVQKRIIRDYYSQDFFNSSNPLEDDIENAESVTLKGE